MTITGIALTENYGLLEGQSHNKAVPAALTCCATQNQVRNRGFPAVCQKLLRRHQRVRDGVDGEGDAVLHSDFAHQFCDVSFHGALFDAQG